MSSTTEPHEWGPIVTGTPAADSDVPITSVRKTAQLRCTGCEETFAYVAAGKQGALLIYRPTKWAKDAHVVWVSNDDHPELMRSWLLKGEARRRRAKQLHVLNLSQYRDSGPADRAVLACRCRDPHIADPHVLYRMAVDGGASVLPGMPPARDVIPIGRGECIDGLNRELFAKVQRLRRRMGPEAWADLETYAVRNQDGTVAPPATPDVP